MDFLSLIFFPPETAGAPHTPATLKLILATGPNIKLYTNKRKKLVIPKDDIFNIKGTIYGIKVKIIIVEIAALSNSYPEKSGILFLLAKCIAGIEHIKVRKYKAAIIIFNIKLVFFIWFIFFPTIEQYPLTNIRLKYNKEKNNETR